MLLGSRRRSSSIVPYLAANWECAFRSYGILPLEEGFSEDRTRLVFGKVSMEKVTYSKMLEEKKSRVAWARSGRMPGWRALVPCFQAMVS